MTKSRLRSLGRSALLVYLFLMSGPILEKVFAPHTALRSASAGQGSDVILLCFSLLLMVSTALVLVRAFRPIFGLLLAERWLLLVHLLAALSIGWSPEKAFTVREVFYAYLYLLSAAYVAVHFSMDRLFALFSKLTLVLAILSVPVQLLLPTIEDPHEVPGWEGVFTQKNILGIAMVLGLTTLLLEKKTWTPQRVTSGTLYIVILILSKSTTSMVCALALVCVVILLRLETKAKFLFIVATAAVIAIGYFASQTIFIGFLESTGKETTLTGRTEIWAFALRGIAERPWLGWGFNTFWQYHDLAALQVLSWDPGQAHNAVLEIILNAGIIGLIICLFELISSFRRGLRLLKYGKTVAGEWVIVLVILIIVQGISEANLLHGGFFWTLFLVCSLCSKRALLGLKHPQAAWLNVFQTSHFAEGPIP